MKRNRFEQVDEVQDDAITLTLSKRGEDAFGTVTCPPGLVGRLGEGAVSPELGAVEAFRSTVKLANELKVAVVVVDPDGVWLKEWGDLYRPA